MLASEPKRKILITGASGFIGSHLMRALGSRSQFEVLGPEFDLTSYSSTLEAVGLRRWDTVIHLAGLSHVSSAEKDPENAYRVNAGGTAVLLEAMEKRCPAAHLIFASTAQVYQGPSGDELSRGVSFDEQRRIAPQNLYARTKRAAEVILQDWSQSHGTPITILRLFNHSHKSQSPTAFLPSLYAAMVDAPESRGPQEIQVGNLDLERDIGAISDLIDAFASLLHTPRLDHQCETLNLCSGVARNLRLLAEGLARKLGKDVRFVADPGRFRQGEPKSIQGNHEKFSQRTGWRPRCLSQDDFLESFLKDQ